MNLSKPSGGETLVERLRIVAAQTWPETDEAPHLLSEAASRIEALEGERDEAHAALKWMNQVYPSARYGGAWVSMTWPEFNRMRRFVGLRELPSRAPKGERPSVNLGLRIALAEAEARADRAEAILKTERVRDREVIARIIDPHGWSLWGEGFAGPTSDIAAGRRRTREDSLRKADAILSAVSQREGGDSSAQSQPGYDGERAASATQSLLRLSGFTPFRIVETPDYAEVHAANGDGKHAFCLTTSPSFFEELNAIAEGKL